MNPFDWFVLLLVCIMGISGFHEGLVRGGIKLAGFFLIIIALTVFAGQIAGFARGLEGIPPKLAVPVTFFGVYAAGAILFAVLAETMRRAVHLTPLGFVDNGLGVLFGVIKGVFIAGILALIFSFMPKHGKMNTQFETSRFGSGLVGFITKSIPAVTSAGIGIVNHISPQVKPEKIENRKIMDAQPDSTI